MRNFFFRWLDGYVWERLKEPTTWRGLVLLLTSLGVGLSHEQSEVIISAGLAIAGAIGAFVPEGRDG